MSNSPKAKSLLLREAFNLIRVKSSYRDTRRYAVNNLAQTLNKIILLRYKKIVNKFKSQGVIRRLGYALTQSIRRLFYFIDFKIFANKKAGFDSLKSFVRAKNYYLKLKVPNQVVRPKDDKDQKATLLRDNKMIAVVRILNMFRKISLYDRKTIKLFRKWQLEDLRNLVNGYERNNCLLYLTLRNLSVVYMVKGLENIRKRVLQDCLYDLMKNINHMQQTEALKLRKLSNILMKKKITDDTMTLNLSVIVTFKKFFKNLVEAKSNDERKEIKILGAINTICFYWKRNLAYNFRQYFRKCFQKLIPVGKSSVIQLVQETKLSKNIRIRNLVGTLHMAFMRRLKLSFVKIMNDRSKELLKTRSLVFLSKISLSRQLALKRILILQENKKSQENSRSLDLLYVGFSKLKENTVNNEEDEELKRETLSLLVQVLRNRMKKNKKVAFQKIQLYEKYSSNNVSQESETKEEDLLMEKHIIRNQAIVANYFQKRINEIGVHLLTQKKNVLLKKILVRKSMDAYEMKRSAFKEWQNSITHWKLSAKLNILKYKKELEIEKNQLSKKLSQLMNEAKTKPDRSEDLFQRKDAGMEYLKFHEEQNTELRNKQRLLEEILRRKKQNGNIYSP